MGTFREDDHPREKVSGRWVEKVKPTTGVALGQVKRGRLTVADCVGQIEGQIAALDSDEAWERLLFTMTRFHKYSLNNQLLIQAQCPGAKQVAGYKAWGRLGRQVRKGERSISILAPRVVREKVTDGGDEVERASLVGFTTVGVFDISQTEGADIADPMADFAEVPPEGFWEDMVAEAGRAGFSVEFGRLGGGADGVTAADGSKRIVIREGLSVGRAASVLGHELGHVLLGHTERFEEYRGGCRGQMEAEAESFSFVLGRMNGMEFNPSKSGGHAVYVGRWMTGGNGKVDTAAVRTALAKVSGEVGRLVKGGQFSNVRSF